MGMSNDTALVVIRSIFTEVLDVHITSVAVITLTFQPLLLKAAAPNVTSGLGSITNVLILGCKMTRAPAYNTSKVGLNGLTAHLQMSENDRVPPKASDADVASVGPRIRLYISSLEF
ncbi:hypothetical protein F4802DRAFT_563049 [Xylaria palmicola]|nr:hypothetical protein F4802DRAFT_563049 [Xylaria palmicola]